MKKKILSVLLLCTLFFSIFSVFASAADDTDVLKEEIEMNYPNLDLTTIPGNKPVVVGAIEDFIDETSLYLYIYNPNKEMILSGCIYDLRVDYEAADGRKGYFVIETIAFSIIDNSNDKCFYKARIDISGKASRMKGYDAIHTYSWERTTVKEASGYTDVIQSYLYKFDYTEGNVKITYDIKETVTLDVYHTYYRTPSATASKNTFDEIHTVYFSIPDKYTKYYSKLYSVASTYTKKKTAPILIGTQKGRFVNPAAELNHFRDMTILSSDYSVVYGEPPDKNQYIESYTGYNISNLEYRRYHILDKTFDGELGYYFYFDGEIGDIKDLKISDEEFLEYVYLFQENYSQINLFESSDFHPWSEKTINDTFDVMYYHDRIQGDLGALVSTYGWKTGIMFWLHRKNPTKLQELSEKYLVDVPKDIPENANLLLCDEQVRNHANTLTDKEFSDNYLINIADVPAFKNYLNTHSNVVLYRFDVDEYYADEVILGKEDFIFIEFEDDYRYVLAQKYEYFDFRVINVTFNDEGTFVSLAVNSHPQDFGSDPGGWEGEPPIELNPKPDDLGDDLGDDLKAKAIRLIINVVMVVIIVAVVIFGISGVMDGIFSLSFKKKDKGKKNE